MGLLTISLPKNNSHTFLKPLRCLFADGCLEEILTAPELCTCNKGENAHGHVRQRDREATGELQKSLCHKIGTKGGTVKI